MNARWYIRKNLRIPFIIYFFELNHQGYSKFLLFCVLVSLFFFTYHLLPSKTMHFLRSSLLSWFVCSILTFIKNKLKRGEKSPLCARVQVLWGGNTKFVGKLKLYFSKSRLKILKQSHLLIFVRYRLKPRVEKGICRCEGWVNWEN